MREQLLLIREREVKARRVLGSHYCSLILTTTMSASPERREPSNDRQENSPERRDGSVDRGRRDNSRDDSRDRRGGSRDRRGGSRDRGRDNRRGSGERSASSLLVRNLSYRVTGDEIRRMMSEFGEVRDVYIPRDHYSKQPRGFCFVEFLDGRDAREAQEKLDGSDFDGREIKIVFAKENRKTPDQMRRTQPPPRRDRSRDRDRRDRSRDRYDDRDRRRGGNQRRSRSRSRDSRRRRRDSPSRSRSNDPKKYSPLRSPVRDRNQSFDDSRRRRSPSGSR